MLIQIAQRIHRTRRYVALLMLALTGLLALPLQAQHDHRGAAAHVQNQHDASKSFADAQCAEHAAARLQLEQTQLEQAQHQPASTHTDHSCQCLLACASTAALIVTTVVPAPRFIALQPRFAAHTATLPFSAPTPPYRPPIHTASV